MLLINISGGVSDNSANILLDFAKVLAMPRQSSCTMFSVGTHFCCINECQRMAKKFV